MRTLTAIPILTFLITLSCANETKTTANLTSTTHPNDPGIQIKPPDSSKTREAATDDSLPIHGTLDQKQIDQYYPNILDTIKERGTIYAGLLDIKTNSDIYVSMLHNMGTFDQMFLCTHDKGFNLLDKFYIGTSTMFDKTSHTIDYKLTSKNQLEVHHVDYGYVERNNEYEIDTLKYRKYQLTISTNGKIVKK